MNAKGLNRVVRILALPTLGAWLIVYFEYGEIWPFSASSVSVEGETPWSVFRRNFFMLAAIAFTVIELPSILGWTDREKRLNDNRKRDSNYD